jgi:hypothetical protein
MKKNMKSFYTPEHSLSYSFLTEEIPFEKEKVDTYTVKMSEEHYFSNPEYFKKELSNKEEYFKKECFDIFINSKKNNHNYVFDNIEDYISNHSYDELICEDFTKTFFNNIETCISGDYKDHFSVKDSKGHELSHFLFSSPELIKKFHCEYFKISTTLFFEKHRVGEKRESCNIWDKIKITYDLNTQKTQIEITVCTNKSLLNNKELFYTTGILKEDNKFEITKIESLSTEYVDQSSFNLEYARFNGGGSPSYYSVNNKEIFNNKEAYSDFKEIKGFNEKEVLNKFEKILNNNVLAVKEAVEENKATIKEFAEKFYGDYFENKEKIENETNTSEKELDVQEQNECDYDYDDYDDDCE